MRSKSPSLMYFGADFSHHLSFKKGGGAWEEKKQQIAHKNKF